MNLMLSDLSMLTLPHTFLATPPKQQEPLQKFSSCPRHASEIEQTSYWWSNKTFNNIACRSHWMSARPLPKLAVSSNNCHSLERAGCGTLFTRPLTQCKADILAGHGILWGHEPHDQACPALTTPAWMSMACLHARACKIPHEGQIDSRWVKTATSLVS